MAEHNVRGRVIGPGKYKGFESAHRSMNAPGGVLVRHWLELDDGDLEITELVNHGYADVV